MSPAARSAAPGPKRSSHIDMPVAYAAVGASKLPDVTRFPPEGMTPYEEQVRLGSGQPRFMTAVTQLMTWGAQRGAGLEIREIESGSGDHYRPLKIDAAGQPAAPDAEEQQFGPDGEPFIASGTRVEVVGADGETREVLVIYTIDEERGAGFAWGHIDEDGAVGEQLFLIEHRDDDTVWAVSRGFLAAPKSGILGLKGRNAVKNAIDAARSAIEALAPGGGAHRVANGTADAADAAPSEQADED